MSQSYQPDERLTSLPNHEVQANFLSSLTLGIRAFQTSVYGAKQVHEYVVECSLGFTGGVNRQWTVAHRYNHFRALDDFLASSFPYVQRAPRPKKHLFHKGDGVAAKRLPLFHNYVRKLQNDKVAFQIFEVRRFFDVESNLEALFPLPRAPALFPFPGALQEYPQGYLYVKILSARALPLLKPGKRPSTYACMLNLLSNLSPPSNLLISHHIFLFLKHFHHPMHYDINSEWIIKIPMLF